MGFPKKRQLLFVKEVEQAFVAKSKRINIDEFSNRISKLKNNLIEELKDNLMNSEKNPNGIENYLIFLEEDLIKLPTYDIPGRGFMKMMYKYKSDSEIEENEYFIKKGEIVVSAISEVIKWIEKHLSRTSKVIETKTLLPNENELNYDLSKSKATEKIIFLKELGILDNLRTIQPFATTINSLATILSAITGEQTTTLQPYLNSLYGKGIDTNKNPYNSEKTVKKVQDQLIKIGFQINKPKGTI